jgi:hypothetical protein
MGKKLVSGMWIRARLTHFSLQIKTKIAYDRSFYENNSTGLFSNLIPVSLLTFII